MKSQALPFSVVPTLSELKEGFPPLKALFFDMDGTLFNTESVHAEAMLMVAAKYRIRSPHSPEVVHALMMGKADHLVFDLIKDWEGVPKEWTAQNFIDEKNAYIITLLQNLPASHYFAPEVSSLLKMAREQGMYIALITSSEKMVTQKLLEITKLDQFFDLILTRDDCPKHKPDPWPYLKAMEVCGYEKHEILIFEDSLVGLEAAKSSGTHVIKVEWY